LEASIKILYKLANPVYLCEKTKGYWFFFWEKRY
jgi:hypothetical protein